MRYVYLFFLGLVAPSADLAQAKAEKPILVLNAGAHTNSIPRLVFTPDGKQLITISKDKTIRVWDVASGETLQVLRPPVGRGREGTLYGLALSPDGRRLAVGGLGPQTDDCWVYLLSFPEGRIERVLKGHRNTIVDLAFSPDGKRLASTGEDNTARIWNPKTGECTQVLQGHTRACYGLVFSPDGRRLATASFDGTARIWNLADGQTETVLKDAYQGRFYGVRSIDWSLDGKSVATGSQDWCVCLWYADGRLRKRYGPFGDAVTSVKFTPNSQELLFTLGYDRSSDCALLNLQTGEQRIRFTRHSVGVWKGTVSPDGLLAATAGRNGEGVYLWKTADGSLVHRLTGRSRNPWSAAWSPDGKQVVWGNTGRPGSVNAAFPLERTFDLGELELGKAIATKYQTAEVTRGGLSLQRHPKEDAVATPVSTLRVPEPPACFTFLGADRAAVGTIHGLYLFDVQSGKRLRAFQGHTDNLRAVAPSPDGRYLLSAADDQTLRVWTPNRDEPLLSQFVAGDDWVAWTPEGYYAASPGGERLMGWQVNNGPEAMGTFHPAAQFRKTLYRPDVIKRLIATGSLEKALAEADQARGQESRRTEVTQVLPPLVSITTPRAGQRLADAQFEVQAVAASVGEHPVVSLRLLLDGRPCPGMQNLIPIKPPKRGKVTATWKVTLPAGSHRLAVQASSAVSQALSDEVEISYTPGDPKTTRTPQASLYVLAIGINAYADRRLQLDAAAPDAQAIEQVFRTKSKPLFRQVETKLLLDRQATRSNILQSLDGLKKQAKPGDVTVVFYAGHGDCKREGQFYLLPVDVDVKKLAATGVSGDELKKRLGKLPSTTLLLLDACYSGSFDGQKRKRALPRAADDLIRELVTDEQGLVVMCGAAKEQEAAEEAGRGFFTRALVEGLSGKAHRDRDGLVTLTKLQAYVEDRVEELSKGEQFPTIGKPTLVRSFPLSKP